MEKQLAVQCVPDEMLKRLKSMAERLWADNNPSSVHLTAVLEEFEPDIKALGQVMKEYETDCYSRVASKESEFLRKETNLKEEVQSLSKRLAALETERAAELKKMEELKLTVKDREARMAQLQSKSMEEERELNLKYVAKMQDLYDRVNKKEMEMLAAWEEKNKSVDVRVQAINADHAERVSQLKLREKALEEDAKARKAELIRTFDRIRGELDARDKVLSAREHALSYWEKAGSRGEARGEGESK